MNLTALKTHHFLRIALGIIFAVFLGYASYAESPTRLADHVIAQYGTPPETPHGPLSGDLETALSVIIDGSFDQSGWTTDHAKALLEIVQSQDPRLAWILTDLMRFTWRPEFGTALSDAAIAILDIELKSIRHRPEIIDHLIAWDIPAYPGYLAHKKAVFTRYVPGWDRIFQDGDIDWHLVSWGGVNIDDRAYDTTDEICHCIPAIDNPQVSSANDATWIDDDDIIFGIEINGAYRAYPRQIMEVREMVNDTLGGRHLGIPYCSLCGAAQAFFTDELPNGVERPILRTSGLLIRSNKVMFDVNTYSVFDTFLGKAVTGPLAELDLQLKQATVITTDWGTWRTAYPETTVLVEALALGRDYNLRDTRDAFGPIFPIGDVDPRLPVHEDIIGVLVDSGTPVAFQRSKAVAALINGERIVVGNVHLTLDAGGIRAVDIDGTDLGSHQAYWFAWSQFHPTTVLWPG